MIKTELISPRALKITVPEKLKTEDFQKVAPQIDSLIKQQGKIRLLIDAHDFGGWENMAAVEKHIGFVKTHHQKVERIAVIIAQGWQHWIVATIRIFVHPEIKAYELRDQDKALKWIVE